MKKLILLLALAAFILSGCSSGSNAEQEERFVLETEQQQEYKNIIDETLKSYYWYYDESSFAYFESTVPQENDSTKAMFDAVRENGMELSSSSGKKAVLYTVDLIHFNGNKAGTAYFYFIRDDLAGMYYSAEGNPASAYGFDTRNVFAKGTEFLNYESDLPEIEYTKNNSWNLPDGFMSEGVDSRGNKVYLNIAEGKLMVYRFRNNAFTLMRTSNFPSTMGMAAVSATFYDGNKIAVMLGAVVENQVEGGTARVISEKVIFLDENYNITNKELPLTKDSYTCISSFKNGLLLINDSSGEFYTENGNGDWTSSISYNINVQATAFKEADLDMDGVSEFILTDGKDLFIYREDDHNFICIWRTNISVDSFYGYIYTGDTNGDNAEEIYIADNTGTAIRYTLSINGLVSKNEDINYGDMFYVGDFNDDGKADYIKVEGAENPEKTLFIAK
ncbi:hypothetical protein NE664_00345 [Anaerotignum faecicola]|nr:hypothetical protein [Anaerotignum faecicola]